MILVFAICLESWSLRTAVKEADHVKPQGVGWWRFIRTAKQPELPVVLLEDTGAEIGLFLALFGVLMATGPTTVGGTRWARWRSASCSMLDRDLPGDRDEGLLIGEAASADHDAIVGAIKASPYVDRLIHMRTEHLGPDEILVTAKVEYASTLTFDELPPRSARRRSASGDVAAVHADLHRARSPPPRRPE